MTSDRYEIEQNIRFNLGEKIRTNYSDYLHDASACSFDDKDKDLTILLFFHNDAMKEHAKVKGIVTEIEEFCLKELSHIELEELRTYGIHLICDSHENVVRTNGGNYLMYRR